MQQLVTYVRLTRAFKRKRVASVYSQRRHSPPVQSCKMLCRRRHTDTRVRDTDADGRREISRNTCAVSNGKKENAILQNIDLAQPADTQ